MIFSEVVYSVNSFFEEGGIFTPDDLIGMMSVNGQSGGWKLDTQPGDNIEVVVVEG